MTLRFLGKAPDSKDGDSPSLWHDDADGSVVVQGWKEEGNPAVLAELLATSRCDHVPANEAIVRIPCSLLPLLKELMNDDSHDGR
ncbi:hypothetical protein AGRA3207_004458 [Actinomadura graeca]|uniref:Uncharacterized protein n=1 Tax=Actinomadura graeca TaxID=2750812 RepID=A0ABX8R021_9ACTN|nr:hypothetical protein [Actinomadura graeca]QXJ23317.1 hypothetical protein AGRA3207_004458 [Actinomadura graeca]